MQSQNRFFDDFARVAAGALGALSGVKSEVESRLREQLERVLAGMDLVSRDEFEAVKAMAAKARAEQEDLAKRVEALEARLPRRRRATRFGARSLLISSGTESRQGREDRPAGSHDHRRRWSADFAVPPRLGVTFCRAARGGLDDFCSHV